MIRHRWIQIPGWFPFPGFCTMSNRTFQSLQVTAWLFEFYKKIVLNKSIFVPTTVSTRNFHFHGCLVMTRPTSSYYGFSTTFWTFCGFCRSRHDNLLSYQLPIRIFRQVGRYLIVNDIYRAPIVQDSDQGDRKRRVLQQSFF